VDRPRITYVADPNATPETELSALVAVYEFLLNCRAKKEAAPEKPPRSPKGESECFGQAQYTKNDLNDVVFHADGS
jgi:hypothetical protein